MEIAIVFRVGFGLPRPRQAAPSFGMSEKFVIERGARIAQAVLAPVSRAAWREGESLDVTVRDRGGFGSTGAAAALDMVARGGTSDSRESYDGTED